MTTAAPYPIDEERPEPERIQTPLHEMLPTPPGELPPTRSRLVSLDVFRGMTIALMLLVNNLDDPKCVPLEHSPWNGWTPTDLVFPFFLFIMGVAMPFSFARRFTDATMSTRSMLARVWSRGLSIFMIGMLLRIAPGKFPAAVPGFMSVQIMRYIIAIFAYGGLIALLIPWRSRR